MKSKVIPVIHYESDEQVLRNAEIAYDAGCAGVFLINMDINVAHDVNDRKDVLAPVAKTIKSKWTDFLVGINYLDYSAEEAMTVNIENGLDMTWTDEQLTHSNASPWHDAMRVSTALKEHPGHKLFSGVAFKHQRSEPEPEVAATKAVGFGFIPTTSGAATGVAAQIGKIEHIRNALGADADLAIASGVTPDNVERYAPLLSYILVATGVSESFYEFDYEKLYQLRVRAG